MLLGILPDIARGPFGERAELGEHLAGGQREDFVRLQVGARLGLLAAQAGDPCVVGAERTEERFDLAQAAAAVGRGLIEDAEFRFLLGDGCSGCDVDEVQIPLGGDAVAICKRLREVIAGFEKDAPECAEESARTMWSTTTSSA